MASREERLDPVTGEVLRPAGAPRPDSRTVAQTAGAGASGARFRLGIAGYDLWPHAVNFCRALREAEFVRISAVWDPDPRGLARLVELTGAQGYTDLDAFCRSDIQGAVLTARTSLKRTIVDALAAAGKHVLADKPMAMSTAECQEMIRACRAAGVMLMGGYNFRYWKAWRTMKAVMDTGELGAPVHLYCAYNTGPVRRTEWDESLASPLTDPTTTPGGGWIVHGDHAIDLTRWLFRTEFVDVVADMRTLRYTQFGVEDYGVAHCLLANGATALIQSDAIAPASRLDVIVTCQKGGMSYTQRPETRLKVWGAPSLGADAVEYAMPEHWVDALRELTRAFVHAVEQDLPPPITGEDNMRVIEVAEAAYRSAREGGRVAVVRAPAS
jgi:predicted dehydrogenase